MPRKKVGPEVRLADAKSELARKLAEELKSSGDSGQPLIWEQTFRTGKAIVNVIWDAWDRVPLQERTATILRAYEMAEGADSSERIALASGLTVPEAYVAGMLPFQLIAGLRKNDPVTVEEVRGAMLEEGASELLNPQMPQLRFATEEDAEAARQRLIKRLPKSEPIWIIHRDITAHDFTEARDWAQIPE